MNRILPQVAVHGGAGAWDKSDHSIVLDGIKKSVSRGIDMLRQGSSALDAVEASIIELEDNPIFDAGYGSFLNKEGFIEMDAIIVDAARETFGSVAAVRHVKNPIKLARLVLDATPSCMYVGHGADKLASELNCECVPLLHLITEDTFRQFRLPTNSKSEVQGTVGAIALDQYGNIASGTSTGGTPNKPVGRVGDSPIYGAGAYARNHVGGASATGIGEDIMRYFLSKQAVDNMQTLTVQDAANAALQQLLDKVSNTEAGLIVLDTSGKIGMAFNTPYMPIGWVNDSNEVIAMMDGKYGVASR